MIFQNTSHSCPTFKLFKKLFDLLICCLAFEQKWKVQPKHGEQLKSSRTWLDYYLKTLKTAFLLLFKRKECSLLNLLFEDIMRNTYTDRTPKVGNDNLWLQRKDGNEHDCGGTAISRTYCRTGPKKPQ